MTSPRFFIVIAVLIALTIGGFLRWPFWLTVGVGTLAFVGTWAVRPVKDLRRAMSKFNKSILQRKRADLGSILMATGTVLVVYLFIPAFSYGVGFVLSAILRGISA